MITQEYLKEALHYCPDTGIFTWIKARPKVVVGSIAGCLNPSGYINIKLDSKVYKAHRLAFLFMNGEFPKAGTDHKDHVKHNNIWSNLRHATQAVNNKNKSMHKNNTSGFTGVHRRKKDEKWVASIRISGKVKHLGSFEDINDAVAARKVANVKYGFHRNHGE